MNTKPRMIHSIPWLLRVQAGPTTHSVGTFVRRTVVAYHQNSDVLAKFWLCMIGVRFMGIATLREEHDARSTLSRVGL